MRQSVLRRCVSSTPTFLGICPTPISLLRLRTVLDSSGIREQTGLDLGEARDGAWAGPTTLTNPQDARTYVLQRHNTHTQKLTSKVLSAIHKPLYSLRPLPSQIMYSKTRPADASAFSRVFLLPQFCEAGAMTFTLFSSNEEISSEGLSDLSKVVQLLVEKPGLKAQFSLSCSVALR